MHQAAVRAVRFTAAPLIENTKHMSADARHLVRYATPPATDLQFKAAATLLFDTKAHTSSTSATWEQSPQFCVNFDRNFEDAVGWKGSFEGTDFISFQHLRVAIAPC